MRRLTLRGRVTLATVGVLALGLAAVSVLFNLLLDDQLDADASSVLRSRVTTQLATLEVREGRLRAEKRPNDAALDRDSWVFVGRRTLEQPASAPPEVRRAVAGLMGAPRRTERTSGATRLLAVPVRGQLGRQIGTVVVSVSLVPYQHTRRIALIGTAILSLVLLVAALIAVRWAMRAALRPIAAMTERAADWSEHDLHRRFDLGPPRDELTALAATFDGLLRRIEAVLRHEQRFSAEMAHELRTPLAGLRGEAELALRRGQLDDGTRTSFDHILGATRRMGTVIETLLSSARMTDGAGGGSCDPVPAAREAVAAAAGAGAGHGVEIRLADPIEDITVDAGPEIVTQALYPLLENGVRHASSLVEVSVAPHDGTVAVAVVDDGPGFGDGADDGEDLFAPGVSSTGGAGLGLPLARRLARSCGGDVRPVPGPGGARFELRLPGGPSAGPGR